MKTLNKISILSVAFIFAIFTSCENEDYLVFTAQEPSDAVTLSMNIQTSYLVSEQTASNLAERIIWSEPDFGAPTPNVYVVEKTGEQSSGQIQQFSKGEMRSRDKKGSKKGSKTKTKRDIITMIEKPINING